MPRTIVTNNSTHIHLTFIPEECRSDARTRQRRQSEMLGKLISPFMSNEHARSVHFEKPLNYSYSKYFRCSYQLIWMWRCGFSAFDGMVFVCSRAFVFHFNRIFGWLECSHVCSEHYMEQRMKDFNTYTRTQHLVDIKMWLIYYYECSFFFFSESSPSF